jgi:hypothetical protein
METSLANIPLPECLRSRLAVGCLLAVGCPLAFLRECGFGEAVRSRASGFPSGQAWRFHRAK